MKYRRRIDLHSLLKPRNRQSWNKINLYNIMRSGQGSIVNSNRTFYQQKWEAKAATRAYHGEHIKEGHWERLFSRRLPAVVEMDPRYMAHHDGAEQASGRGSGRDNLQQKALRGHESWSKTRTPYMHMTYWPMERRLDVAIFRALFASSTRQARQLVIHGSVKVNGRKMQYPGYLLNPGDMFQVDVDKVLRATGLTKDKDRFVTKIRKEILARTANSDASEAENAEESADAAESADAEESADAGGSTAVEDSAANPANNLSGIISQIRTLLASREKLKITNSDQRKLRRIRLFARYATAHSDSPNATAVLANALAKITRRIEARAGADVLQAALEQSSAQLPPSAEADEKTKTAAALAPGEPRWPVTKRVWQPKDYMSPFAFIPRYLEVNHKICAAVYLRHPVARQGMTEIPTPFPLPVSQLAFNWYLRRR